jgi:hypothetical protein
MTKPLLRRLPIGSVIALTCFLSASIPAATQELTPQGDKLMSQVYRDGMLKRLGQQCIAHQKAKMIIGVPEEVTTGFCGCAARLIVETFSTDEVIGLLTLDVEQRNRDPKLKAGIVLITKACNDEANQNWKKQRELKHQEREAQRNVKQKDLRK